MTSHPTHTGQQLVRIYLTACNAKQCRTAIQWRDLWQGALITPLTVMISPVSHLDAGASGMMGSRERWSWWEVALAVFVGLIVLAQLAYFADPTSYALDQPAQNADRAEGQ